MQNDAVYHTTHFGVFTMMGYASFKSLQIDTEITQEMNEKQ